MKTGEAVREIMKEKEIGVNQMADKLGKSPRLVSERLSQDNISIAKLCEMLDILNYEIVLVPKETEISENWYKIE